MKPNLCCVPKVISCEVRDMADKRMMMPEIVSEIKSRRHGSYGRRGRQP